LIKVYYDDCHFLTEEGQSLDKKNIMKEIRLKNII